MQEYVAPESAGAKEESSTPDGLAEWEKELLQAKTAVPNPWDGIESMKGPGLEEGLLALVKNQQSQIASLQKDMLKCAEVLDRTSQVVLKLTQRIMHVDNKHSGTPCGCTNCTVKPE